MKRGISLALCGASMLTLATMAQAQPAADASSAEVAVEDVEEEDLTGVVDSQEIIVTARRREERLQDVPQTINVVSAADIEKLNLRNFTEIQAVVPGLTLSGGGSFSTAATVRGVAFNPEASGNNATVEFYLNDAPIASSFLFQSMFDVGQFELLRGPQGTLRGRASPSGSITVTTRRPDLYEIGAVGNVTLTDTHSYKADVALNVPIIENMLGVRIAGVYDDNDGNEVSSIKEQRGITPAPFRKTQALRASARFDPADFMSLNFMYQTLEHEQVQFGAVQSASLVTGQAPTATRTINASDRLSLDDTGPHEGQNQQIYLWNADFHFAGQTLSYVGSYNKQDFYSLSANDSGDYFAPPRFPLRSRAFRDPAGAEQVCQQQSLRAGVNPTNQAYFQCTHGIATRESHEIRLASEERIAGFLDYVVGALSDHNVPETRLTVETPLLANATTVALVNLTGILRDAETTERSAFGNLTAHLGDRLELSAGLRYIEYENFSSFIQNGVRTIPDKDEEYSATIYMASAKYSFSDDFMVYATVGSSWRPGAFAVGDFNLQPTALERSFFDLPPEESTSYELGLKTSFMGGRGRFNISAYQQDFDNYVYRGPAVYFVNYALQGGVVRPGVSSFNFVAAVPARVRGVEAEASFQILPRWGISGNVSYADGRVKDGTIACNDFDGDGAPDLNVAQPTLAQLQAAVGAGENISACSFDGRTLNGPKWNANIQSEAGFTLAPGADAFVRGLAAITPSHDGDPRNTYDDVDAYTLVNLYAGVRDPDGGWELSLFAKNVFDTERLLSVGSAPLSSSLRTITGGSVNHVSDYYSVGLTAPREFGVNLRVAFGTR